MEEQVKTWLAESLARLREEGLLDDAAEPVVERARQKEHGDFVSNSALALARRAGLPPRELAERIVAHLPQAEALAKVEIAGPGFINFHLRAADDAAMLRDIVAAGAPPAHGDSAPHGAAHAGTNKRRALIEFVSANPTGPLHVGHGRGAAYGSTLAALLEAAGYTVEREYYVNDAGRQIDILAVSVWLRCLELGGATVDFPAAAYHGDYVWDLAADLRRAHGDALDAPAAAVFDDLDDADADADPNANNERRIDALIARARQLLDARYAAVRDAATSAVRADIERDLAAIGVRYDRWTSERALADDGAVAAATAALEDAGHAYRRDGALWFRAAAFGDEKDRVLVRDNGQPTYFAADIAYHIDKYRRGYDLLVNVWGADHHGYIARLRAAMRALNFDDDKLKIVLVQFANLYRGKTRLPMSTRAGEYVTLRELREEIGADPMRYFYVMRKPSQHLDFDLELAKSKSSDNPVYYAQYAHARICSVFRKLADSGLAYNPQEASTLALTADDEIELLRRLPAYRETLANAAARLEPHHLPNFLHALAAAFHAYYNRSRFIVPDDAERNARLLLSDALRATLKAGLGMLGVAAPEKM